jgi:transcriptional regulator with XRE-family HTH domain
MTSPELQELKATATFYHIRQAAIAKRLKRSEAWVSMVLNGQIGIDAEIRERLACAIRELIESR